MEWESNVSGGRGRASSVSVERDGAPRVSEDRDKVSSDSVGREGAGVQQRFGPDAQDKLKLIPSKLASVLFLEKTCRAITFDLQAILRNKL